MAILTQILVVLNALILPFFYTSIKQILYQNQQYGVDLKNLTGASHEDAILKTGQHYQTKYKLLAYLLIVFIIIISQFIYVQYIINNSFRFDKNWLLGLAIICVVLASALPGLLLFSFFYKPEFIGHLQLDKTVKDPLTSVLDINIWSILSFLSGLYILSNIIYLFVFNRVNYICITKVS
mgnify:CR=1 FL=1